MANAEIHVAVETAVHKALADAVQRVADEFGIVIRDARFEWLAVGSMAESRDRCTQVELRTTMATTE